MNKTYILSLFFMFSCGGITKPSYKKYDAAAEKPSPSLEAALASYKANIALNLATCSCHTTGGTPIGGSKLSATDDAVNRKIFLAYTGSTSVKLDEKIRLVSSPKHSGGSLTNPTKAQIDTWLAAEAKVGQ